MSSNVSRSSKCTKIIGGWGFAYSAPPDPLAGIKGPTSKPLTSKGRKGDGRGKVETKEEGP